MTREDIIQMAREAGFSYHENIINGGVSDLERFAQLVAAAEREACALACEKETDFFDNNSVHYEVCADAIRARGQA